MKRSLYVLSVLLLACYVLSVLLLARTAWTAPAPRPSLKGWGDPVDPDNDCKIRLDRDILSIEMPGTEHEFDPPRNRFNAPRIVREIEGDFDLQFRLRIDCPHTAQSSVEGRPAYVAAGFLVIYPDSPRYEFFCNRWDYGFVQQRVGIDDFLDKPRFLGDPQIKKKSRKGIGEHGCTLGMSWAYASKRLRNGELIIHRNQFERGTLVIADRGDPFWPLKGRVDRVYLRLKREDKLIVFSLSPDGEKWYWRSKCTWAGRPKKIKVGFAAYTTSAQPSKVRFDQLKLWRRGERKSK